MSDLIVVVVLLSLVVLVLMGQWLMNRRAALARGPAPESLRERCPEAVMVFFHSRRCPACARMRPVLAELAEANPDRVCLLDVAEEPAVARDSRVIGTPTLMTIEAGTIRNVRLGDVPATAIDRMALEQGLQGRNARPENG